ncbi:MAG: N-acetylmuramoyl-L-alanine amidase [Pelobium sp.]
MEFFLYLAKVAACTAIFYFFYHLLLSKLTFFSVNRWYLIGTLVLSFIIPLLSVTIEKNVAIPLIQKNTAIIAVSNSRSTAVDPEFLDDHLASTKNQVSLKTILMGIYACVFAFLLIRFLIGIVSILWKSRNFEYRGKLKYVAVSSDCSFKNSSFHRYLFIDESLSDAVKKQVILHEALHIQSFHFIDKLLVGLGTAMLWFNPFSYAYLHAIDANHEFEVDAKSILNFDKKSYASLILTLAQSSNNLLMNHFSRLPLKRRMAMLFKNPTNRMKKLIYVSVLPLIGICCVAFIKQKEVMVYVKSSVSPLEGQAVQKSEMVVDQTIFESGKSGIVKESSIPDSIYERELMTYVEVNQSSRISPVNFVIQKPVIRKQRVLVIDPGHGGKDGASKSITGVPEKEMTLKAALILKEEAEKRGIKVIMTRETDEFVELYKRRDIGNLGDAFISLHFNQMSMKRNKPDPNSFRGIEVFVCSEIRATKKTKDSQIFGSNILNALKNINGIQVRDSIKQQGMTVLTNEVVPSVAIELGNISFQESFDFVSDENNLRKICNLILDGYDKPGC